MDLTNKRKLVLVFCVLGLAMLSCTEVLVENRTQFPVRVQMTMPGWSSIETRKLDANDSYMFQAEEEGLYRVSAVAEEDFINMCKEKRNEMSLVLNSNYDTMTKAEIEKAVTDLAGFNRMIDKMKPVTCVSQVYQDHTPVVEINWNPYSQEWSITCP